MGGLPKPWKSGPRRVPPRMWAPRWVGGPNLEKMGPRRVGPRKGGGPKGWGPERVGGPKISRFFLTFPPPFRCFCVSVGVFSGRSMCTFGVPSCSPGGPVWWGRLGFTRQPESPNVHISGSLPSKHHQNSTRTHPERHRNSETVAGKGRKRAKFWAVRRTGVRRTGVRRNVVQGSPNQQQPKQPQPRQNCGQLSQTRFRVGTTTQHNNTKQHKTTTNNTKQQHKTTTQHNNTKQQHNNTTQQHNTTQQQQHNRNTKTPKLAKVGVAKIGQNSDFAF